MHLLFWDPELSRMHLHPLIRIPNAIPVSTLFLGRSFYIKDFQIKFEFRIYSYKLCAPIFWPRGLISVKVISNIVYRINFKRCEGNLRSSDFENFQSRLNPTPSFCQSIWCHQYWFVLFMKTEKVSVRSLFLQLLTKNFDILQFQFNGILLWSLPTWNISQSFTSRFRNRKN